MTEKLTIQATGYNDLIATVYHRLGFVPSESLVLIALNGHGPRSQVGLVARVDLANVEQGHEQLARVLVEKGGADTVCMMVFTDDDHSPTWRYPLTLMRSVLTVPVAHEFVITGGRYMLPEEGQWHLLDVSTSSVMAHLVHRGSAVAKSREDLLPVWTDKHAMKVARASARKARPFPDLAQGWADAVQSVAAGKTLTPTGLGRLAGSLSDRVARDAVLVLAAGGSVEDCREVATKGPRADAIAGAAMQPMMSAAHAKAPDPDVVGNWLTLLGQVAAATHGSPHAVPAWTLLAILSWWMGDGAPAAVANERALALDPDYKLAQLLDNALSAGIPPAWVRKH